MTGSAITNPPLRSQNYTNNFKLNRCPKLRIAVTTTPQASSSPVHAALLQNGSGNSSGVEVTTLPHNRRRDAAFVAIIITPDTLVSTQTVFRVVKAPPPLAADTVPIKILTIGAYSCGITNSFRETAMRDLFSALVVPISDNSKDDERNGTERRYYTDDRVLAHFGRT